MFGPSRPRRRSNAIAAIVERLEARCVLTAIAAPTPVVIEVLKPASVAPKLDGSVPDIELRIIGLNFVDDSIAGLKSVVVVNGVEWDTFRFSGNAIIATPRSGSSNGLRWDTNFLHVRNEAANTNAFSNSFIWTLPIPKLKVTGFETGNLVAGKVEPSSPLRGQPFVISIEGENFTDLTTVDIGSFLDPFSALSILERSSTHLLVGVEGRMVSKTGDYFIQLTNPGSASNTDAVLKFRIPYLVPEITSVTPSSLDLGININASTSLQFTITGSEFSTIENGGESIITLLRDGDAPFEDIQIIFPGKVPGNVTETQIKFSVEARVFRQWTGFTVGVRNKFFSSSSPDSNRIHVSLTPPEPFIASLSEVTALVGSSAKTIQIEGQDFANSVVRVGAIVLVPETQSANVLQVTLPAAQLTTTGITAVTVENQDPDGNTVSNAKPFGVFASANALQVFDNTSDDSKIIDGMGATLNVSLVQERATPTFQPGAVVKFNGVIVGSVSGLVANSSISATIPASLLASPEVASVTIENADGTVFGPVAYSVKSPIPTRIGNEIIGTATVGTETVLRLRGSLFFPGARVLLNGDELPSKFIDSQTLDVTIEADRLPLERQTDGTVYSLTVENPAPRAAGTGGVPDVWKFVAAFPTPTIDAISSSTTLAGLPTQTVIIAGSGFIEGLTLAHLDLPDDAAIVQGETRFNIGLPTQFLSESLLSVEVPSNVGSHQIRVATDTRKTDFGLKSNQVAYDVLFPRPFISEISPSFSPTRSSQPPLDDPTNVSVTITGTGFKPGFFQTLTLQVQGPNGESITHSGITELTDTQLTFSLSRSLPVGSYTISVSNPTPGGGTSNPMSFVFTRPRPRVAAVAERTFGGGISAGAPNTLISVTGLDFVDRSAVVWNGMRLATTFVSATRLDATVPAELLRVAGDALVTISGGDAPDSAGPRSVQVSPFFAIISSISPDNAPPGGGSKIVTVTGDYFLNGAVAQWNGEPRATTYVSGQQVTMTLTAADLAQVGSGIIRVVNPNGMTFGTRSFSVRNPLPVITSISPATVTAGSVTAPNAFMLTIHGTGFVNDQTGLNSMAVEVNKPDNPNLFFNSEVTVIDSPTQMRVFIAADRIATARTAQIQIRQTGVGVSNRFDLVINNGSFSIVPTNAVKLEGNAATTLFTFTVTRNGATTTAGSVDYTVTGSATNAAEASDFAGNVFPAAMVNFAPNQTSQIVTITVAGDTTIEPCRTKIEMSQGSPT